MRVAEYIKHLKTLPQDWHVDSVYHKVRIRQYMTRWTHTFKDLSASQGYAICYRTGFSDSMGFSLWQDPWHTTGWDNPLLTRAFAEGERDGALQKLELEHKAHPSWPEADDMVGHRMECIAVNIRHEMRFHDLVAAKQYMWDHYVDHDSYVNFQEYLNESYQRFKRMFIDGELCYVDTDFNYTITYRMLLTLQRQWFQPGKFTE